MTDNGGNDQGSYMRWLLAREGFFGSAERPWWRRGAAVVALLFLLNALTVIGLWLVDLADALPAGLISGVSFVIVYVMVGYDGAMEKDK